MMHIRKRDDWWRTYCGRATSLFPSTSPAAAKKDACGLCRKRAAKDLSTRRG